MKSHTIKQHDNLLALADFLEQIPEQNFEMKYFFERRDKMDYSKAGLDALTVDQHLSCGTTCCVAGWAAALHPDEFLGVEIGPVNEPMRHRFTRFFGLHLLDTHEICFENYSATAKEKATQIREILSGYEVTV